MKQNQEYNQKYPHLASELRNTFDSLTDTWSDIYSLGLVYQHVADEGNSLLQTSHNKWFRTIQATAQTFVKFKDF